MSFVLYVDIPKVDTLIILRVVLYGREIVFFYTETKHRLKVFQNRMLRRVFGRDEIEEGKQTEYKGELPALILCISWQVPSNQGGWDKWYWIKSNRNALKM